MAVPTFDVNAFVYNSIFATPAPGTSSTVRLTGADADINKLYYSTVTASPSDDANGDGTFNVGETVTLTNHNDVGQFFGATDTTLTVLGSGTFSWESSLAPNFGGSADVLVTTDGTKTYLVFVNGPQDSHTSNNHDPDAGPSFGELVRNTSLTWSGVGYKPGTGPICFGRGTLIETARGAVAVEDLAIGDLVLTKDNGPQPIRWIGATKLDAGRLASAPKFRPIRIAAGALGGGLPTADLVVSPQHRVLVRSKIAERMAGAPEVLVAAKQLLQIEGIEIAAEMAEVEYFHILFDRHEVIVSNGAETESLFVGPVALRSVSAEARAEILALFPELAGTGLVARPARPLMAGRQARNLAERHQNHGRALV